jgi:hypothetical protein
MHAEKIVSGVLGLVLTDAVMRKEWNSGALQTILFRVSGSNVCGSNAWRCVQGVGSRR